MMGGSPRSSRGGTADLVQPAASVSAEPAVSRVLDSPTSLDSIGFGALLGLPVGVLAAALVVRLDPLLPTSSVVGAFVLFWPLGTWMLARGTRRVLVVLRRACLLAAALWAALALAPGIDPALGRPSELGLADALSGRLAEGMAWISLAAFALLLMGQRAAARAALGSDGPLLAEAQDESAPLQK